MTRRRWWLLPIGASAGMAVWSGWVGLGGLTGFGVMKPFPGIPRLDAVEVNTAITLPLGMEAYAMFALWVATSSFGFDEGTRLFAKRTSWAALALGAFGQVAYHLMSAAGWTRAPWFVTAFVACIPVGVLGLAANLLHRTARASSRPERVESSEADASIGASESVTTSEDVPSALVDPVEASERASRSDAVERVESSGASEQAERDGVVVPIESHRHAPAARRASETSARQSDVENIRSAIEQGDLTHPLKIAVVMKQLHIGAKSAKAAIAQIEDERARA